MKAEGDLVLFGNAMPWAQLYSEATGFSLNLHKQLARADKPNAFDIIDVPFSVASETVAKFEDMAPKIQGVEIPRAGRAKASATVKAKAKAKSKARASRAVRHVAVPR